MNAALELVNTLPQWSRLAGPVRRDERVDRRLRRNQVALRVPGQDAAITKRALVEWHSTQVEHLHEPAAKVLDLRERVKFASAIVRPHAALIRTAPRNVVPDRDRWCPAKSPGHRTDRCENT